MTIEMQHGNYRARVWHRGERISATGSTPAEAAARVLLKMGGQPVGVGQGGVIARLVDFRDGAWRWKVYTADKTLAEGQSESYKAALEAVNSCKVRPGNPDWRTEKE